tara:strand:- start:610 stop:2808 length:2199 start_codon:yes stop_codon:yes gene_type:complete
MIKKSIKILLSILLLVFLIIFYLSSVGVKTEKFNERIVNKILQINKKINVNLGEVKFLLDPYNFTVNIATKDPIVQLGDNKLEIKELKTNISLKSLFSKKFAVDDLQISTKFIKIDNLILLVRSFKSSTELLLLNNFTKGGSLIADIKLEFDEEGNIKKDYQITGFIKNIKLNFLNKIKVNNLNFEFDIKKNKYSLEKIKGIVNEIKFSSILIEINQKKDNFFIRGKMLTDKKKLIRDKIDSILGSFLKNPNIEKIKFSSESDFSFNVNKKLKINDVRIDSRINLDQLLLKNNLINLKSYLPNMDDVINFENQRVTVNYNKDKINIKGNGEILVKGKPDNISYEVIRDKEKLTFNTKINIKNNKLIIGFLDYEKKENLEASINIKGNLKKNKKINFDLISLIEKDNKISFKDINLSKDFKLISLHNFKFDYLNNKLIKNELVLKKNNSNYSIEGESFDATTLINKIMNSEDKNSSIFDSFNSEISLKINKTYIDELNFINNLSGRLNFKDNKIDNLDLSSFFPNNKKINFLIKTNDKQEKITKLFTDYPKPLIKRYDFIKGFEEGFLVYQSVKKNGVSNSLLTIENFKIKETPIFAKLLSLASLQGISDLLTGEGIRFDNFEMKFSNKKKLTTIEEMYAIGPAVSILMEGYIESKKKISLRGTLVPAATVNKIIASIPLIGNILVGKKTGEGVFGVSFKIKGPPKNPQTTVNPIKTLTPRFIIRTLEKIKKN